MICELRHQHTATCCRGRCKRVTYTTTHVAGKGAGRLSIQSQMLQGVFYSSSHSDRFSGALHPFSPLFLHPCPRCGDRHTMCITTVVRACHDRRQTCMAAAGKQLFTVRMGANGREGLGRQSLSAIFREMEEGSSRLKAP